MAKDYAVVSKTGAVTIPERIRKQLWLKPGIAVRIKVRGNRITLENPFWFDRPDPR